MPAPFDSPNRAKIEADRHIYKSKEDIRSSSPKTCLSPFFFNRLKLNDNMIEYTLKWPADFENYSWQIESKGWFVGLEIHVGGKTLKPTFYDPVRLSQDIAEEISSGGLFTEPCLIVINKVTQELIERAIANLARTGQLERLA